MKTHWMFFLAILYVIASAPYGSGLEVKVLKQEDNGREIAIRQGSIIELHLQEIAGTGYLWEFKDLDNQYFEIVEEGSKSVTDAQLTGTQIIKIWRIKAIKPGMTQLNLYYFRPWEGMNKSADQFLVNVLIS